MPEEETPEFIKSLGPTPPQVRSTLPAQLLSRQQKRQSLQSSPTLKTTPTPPSDESWRLKSQDVLSQWLTILTRTGEPPYPLGLEKMDDILWGVHKKEIMVLGGRPGSGKTSLAVQIALNVAQKAKVLFYTLEMSRPQIVERMISYFGKIENQLLRRGHLDLKKHTARIQEIACEIARLKFFLADDRGYDIEDYSKDISLVKADFIFLDYIQLLKKVEFTKMHESISQILAAFRRISKKLNCGFVICSQLNRQGELKSSGSLEEVGDTVVELDWVGQWSIDPGAQGEYSANVSKQKHGPVGRIKLWYRPDCFQFTD